MNPRSWLGISPANWCIFSDAPRIGHVDALNGIIWTHQTTWSSTIADQVRARSEEIQPGVYQVRVGRTLDHSSLTWVV